MEVFSFRKSGSQLLLVKPSKTAVKKEEGQKEPKGAAAMWVMNFESYSYYLDTFITRFIYNEIICNLEWNHDAQYILIDWCFMWM